MEQLQRLKTLLDQNNLPLKYNDRLFYSEYLYRLEIVMHKFHIPEIYTIKTINAWGHKVDVTHRTNFIGTVRKFAKKQKDRVRVEFGGPCHYLNYYTNSLDNIQEIINYVSRLKKKEKEEADSIIDLGSITAFPGKISERNIRYRKKRLPYNKFKFQILGDRMDHEEIINWREWALQYPDKIKLCKYGDHAIQTSRQWGIWKRTTGIWPGEALAYIIDEKMLHLVQFKLGANIKKIIEFQIKDIEKNDD